MNPTRDLAIAIDSMWKTLRYYGDGQKYRQMQEKCRLEFSKEPKRLMHSIPIEYQWLVDAYPPTFENPRLNHIYTQHITLVSASASAFHYVGMLVWGLNTVSLPFQIALR